LVTETFSVISVTVV